MRPDFPRRPLWTQPLRRLGVSNKLLLIYLLDLITVIFISSVLIHEKYIAIDFSRKELQGTAYIDAIRPTLIGLVPHGAAYRPTDASIDALAAAETSQGAGMRSGELNAVFVSELVTLARARSAAPIESSRIAALKAGSELVTRIGNQSNLILDPDLDTYYTMSLILLRYPALLNVVSEVAPRLRQTNGGMGVTESDRARLYVLMGEVESVGRAMITDHREAVAAARDPILAQTLSPAQQRLSGATEHFLAKAREIAGGKSLEPGAFDQAERELVESIDATWAVGNTQLARMIDARIHDFFVKMWLHLGASLSLLTVILFAVFYVARQISKPLRQLWQVVDTVRRTGDQTLRASWDSEDEIGRLVVAFNHMLAQLDEQRERQQELASAARAAQAQQQLLEGMPVPMMVTSIPDHRVLHANAPAQAWLDDRTDDPWSRALDRSTRRRFFQELSDLGQVNEFEVRWRGTGTDGWAVLSARRLDYQGQDSVVTAFAPVNRLKALEQRLELWAKVFEASSEGIVLLDAARLVVAANSAFCRAGGQDPGELAGRPLACVRFGDESALPQQEFWETAASRGWWRGEVQVERRDGSSFAALSVITAIRDASGSLTHYILSCLDITERKAREEQVRYLAHHDVLTDLPNRTVAQERLRVAMQRCRAFDRRAAVLFIDLDRFKTINDSLGHPVGDALLQQVAARLKTLVRDVDTVSRFGGDEFVVLLDGVTGREEVDVIAHRLLVALREPYRVKSLELRLSCSIGLALYPDDATDMDQLMRHADAAMYEAKAAGRDGVHHFTEDLNDRVQQRMRIDLLLRNAIARNELRLVYQPQVRTPDGALSAVEALLRWYNDELGDVSPEQFIPIAEESRLILEIGAWVLDEACRQMAQWRIDGIDVKVIAVNLSAVQLLDPEFPATLEATLARHGLAPSMLELELTESTLMESAGKQLERLHALRALGVALAIDDFGTGYSSLSYLSRLPTGKVKIDRSLTFDFLTDYKDRAITEAIIALAHRLEMTVVAEGVETAAMLDALKAASCDVAQGYFIGRPMDPDDLARWVRRRLHWPA